MNRASTFVWLRDRLHQHGVAEQRLALTRFGVAMVCSELAAAGALSGNGSGRRCLSRGPGALSGPGQEMRVAAPRIAQIVAHHARRHSRESGNPMAPGTWIFRERWGY